MSTPDNMTVEQTWEQVPLPSPLDQISEVVRQLSEHRERRVLPFVSGKHLGLILSVLEDLERRISYLEGK